MNPEGVKVAAVLSDASSTPLSLRLVSLGGLFLLLLVAWVFSKRRDAVNKRLVFWGLSLQVIFALFIFRGLWLSALALPAVLLIDALWDDAATRRSVEGRKRLRVRAIALAVIALVVGVAWSLPGGSAEYWLSRLFFGEPVGRRAFGVLSTVVNKLLSFTDAGTGFLLTSHMTGDWSPALKNLLFTVLPTIIFFASLMTILYHLGVMQPIVRGMAWLMHRTMRTSGAESMSAAGNIFVGMTEAPLLVKPYVKDMTRSEIMSIMTGGFATVSGGILAAYVAMLARHFPDIAGHLVAASIMNAPAGLVISKILYPETGSPATRAGIGDASLERIDANAIGAAARGASEGMKLYLNVVAMLLAFVALIAMANWIIGLYGEAFASTRRLAAAGGVIAGIACLWAFLSKQAAKRKRNVLLGVGGFLLATVVVYAFWGGQVIELTLERVTGTLLSPVAYMMGIEWSDAAQVGRLLGTKFVLNEFIAYTQLAGIMNDASTAISPRGFAIASYALLGFANIGSIAIQIGGIGGIAPERRTDLAQIGFRAMIAGTMAAYCSACVAGVLL